MKIKTFLMVALCAATVLWSCKKDEQVTPEVVADFTFESGTEGAVTFKNASENATSYAWDFGDGNKSTEESPTHTYTKDSTYTIKLTATNAGGSDEETKTIAIKLKGTDTQLIANFTYELGTEGAVTFKNTSKNATGYAWNFGDGNKSNAQDTTYTFVENKDYAVKLTATNGAGESADTTKIITITNALPIASFEFTVDAQSAGGTVNFVNTSKNATGYAWDFGDGNTSTDKSPTHTYTQNGDFDVRLTATNSAGKSADTTKIITITNALPIASFNFSKDPQSVGGTINFENASKNATSYAWDFGDGNTSTDENPTHTYAKDSTYTVKLTATNKDGSADTTQTVTIDNALVTIAIADLSQLAIPENSPKDTPIGEIAATVANTKETPVYSITSQNPAGAIGLVDGNKMVVKDSSAFDYETNTEVTGEIQGTVGSATATAAFTISITNVDEGIYIPDTKFKAVLLNTNGIDTNGDQEISVAEAQVFNGTITGINKGITDATGIEYFINITSLNLKQNALTKINLFYNTALEYLDVANNNLTALDVSKNTALSRLYVYNNQLTALDVTKNTALIRLWLDNNKLTTIDVTKNTALSRFFISGNQLTTIDVTKNTALTQLTINYNQLTVVDVSKNTALIVLWLNSNNALSKVNLANGANWRLDSLDLRENPNLTCVQVTNIPSPFPPGWRFENASVFRTDACP